MTLRLPLVFLAAALAAAATGCAPTPPPPPTGPPVVGAYTGSLVADGQTFAATMRLQADAAARSSGILRVSPPVDLEGRVSAVAMDDLLRIEVEYTGADGCEGRIVGILDLEQDAGVIEGPVTLTDCAEPVAGRVLFRRTAR